MLNNLFIMFDPSTNFLKLNWLTLFLPLILIWKKYYYIINRELLILNSISMILISDVKNNMNFNYYKSITIFYMIFFLIFMLNLLSILPFVFTPTSHLSISLFLSFPFWSSLMMKSYFQNFNQMMTHLVPLNTPLMLCPFMVLIETISNLIRPFTLAIRLSANMIAGHILLCLLSNMLNNNFLIFFCDSFLLNTLIILEMAVAIIQAYVFIVLMSLYFSETHN